MARLEGECATTPPDKEPVCDDHDEGEYSIVNSHTDLFMWMYMYLASIVLYSQAGHFN